MLRQFSKNMNWANSSSTRLPPDYHGSAFSDIRDPGCWNNAGVCGGFRTKTHNFIKQGGFNSTASAVVGEVELSSCVLGYFVLDTLDRWVSEK